jgi:hypothetical protein
MSAGNAMTYAKVIPAVRDVHLKYLCRLTNMSKYISIDQFVGIEGKVLPYYCI